jgi:1-phosphofructokinase family hexose kinase
MIITITPNPALDKIYWVKRLSYDPETPLVRATKSFHLPGGKGIKVSIFLARLGIESIAMGFVAGQTGRVVERGVRDEGVTTNFVWADGETRINSIILEEGKEGRPIEVNERGPYIEKRAIEHFLQRYKRALLRADCVVLGGSLPPGVDDEFYKKLIELAGKQGIKTIVNTAGRPLEMALEAVPYLVKPDVRERKEICGIELTDGEKIVRVCRDIVKSGVEAVVISHKITGDILITSSGVWGLKAKDVIIKNIIGAGDALVGGMIYKLFREPSSILEATRYGIAAAISSSESTEGMAKDREAVEKELERVEVRRLS